jgi:hypothetical protein
MPRPEPDHLAATATLTRALSELHFPVTKREAIRRVGERAVPLTPGATVQLGEILEGLSESAFHDFGSAAKAADLNWRRVARSLAEIESAERLAPWPPKGANARTPHRRS